MVIRCRAISRKNERFFLGDTDPSDISDEMEKSDDNMFRNTITVGIAREGNENSALVVWPGSSVNAPIENVYDKKRA